jgi:phosphopentomutase
VEGYASALEYFDSKLPEILSLMKDEDILFITADHGCDPTTDSTDHSREHVPMLVYGSKVKENVDLGVRRTFADLGQTVSDYLELGADFEAESFLQDILK